MLNGVQGIGYSSSGTAWIIQINACVIKIRFPTKYTSWDIEIQQVDLELDKGPKFCKIKFIPGSIEIALREVTFARFWTHIQFQIHTLNFDGHASISCRKPET